MPPAARRRRGVENRLDPGGDTDAAEGDVAAGDPLGELDDVRLPPPVLQPEPAPGASEAGDHVVADEEHVVAVADLPDPAEVALRRDDHPSAPSLHRLGDEGGHGLRALSEDGLLEQVCGGLALGDAGRRLEPVPGTRDP
jgi:hypothetical protein